MEFKVTHVLKVRRAGHGGWTYFSVMLHEGVVYRREEWELCTEASYQMNDETKMIELYGDPITYELVPAEDAGTMQEKVYACNTITDLLEVLKDAEEEVDTVGVHLENVLDLDSLPIFSLSEPIHEGGDIYSWDDMYVLKKEDGFWFLEPR